MNRREMLEEGLRDLTRVTSMTLPAIKGRRERLMPNPETIRETAPSCFFSSRLDYDGKFQVLIQRRGLWL